MVDASGAGTVSYFWYCYSKDFLWHTSAPEPSGTFRNAGVGGGGRNQTQKEPQKTQTAKGRIKDYRRVTALITR